MSLKGFHLVFITCAIIISFGFAYWAFHQYTLANTMIYLATALTSCIAAMGLIFYEMACIKKI